MIQIYSIEQAEEWDEVVRTFADYDVYYLSGYVKAFQIHGDGEPFLLYYVSEEGSESRNLGNEESRKSVGLRGIYVYMKRNTAIEGVYDSITPYGYGGFLLEGDASEENMKVLWMAYTEKMKELNIVDNFVRYHPVLGNAFPMKMCSDVIDLGKTVSMDLTSPEVIWTNIHSKNRNMIRKAEKNGIVIKHGQGRNLMDEFMKIYNATMDKDNAEEYYYFKRPFYESIHNDLKDNYEMFWAEIPVEESGNSELRNFGTSEPQACGENKTKIIAMSIMIYANGRLNYHLSGSDINYRNLAPSNLLLYKAALWGCEHGMKTFHLGGGVGSGEDNLFKFKIAFNRFSGLQFSIAKQIFDQEKYDELVEERSNRDEKFDRESKFFPVYRS